MCKGLCGKGCGICALGITSFLAWVLEGHGIFKKRALRTAPQISPLRIVMNPRDNVYPFCFHWHYGHVFPNEVVMGDTLLSEQEQTFNVYLHALPDDIMLLQRQIHYLARHLPPGLQMPPPVV